MGVYPVAVVLQKHKKHKLTHNTQNNTKQTKLQTQQSAYTTHFKKTKPISKPNKKPKID
jgi:hypothetical protein